MYLNIKRLYLCYSNIINASGITVVHYVYDAYGNITKTEVTSGYGYIANINSYTYRGYRYDSEINMYYLNSRYYNPKVGRFINADKIIGQLSHIGSTNMYACVNNNPVNFADEEGEFWHLVGGFVVGAAIGTVTQIVSNVVSGNEWSEGVLTAAAIGGLSGLLTAAGAGSLTIGLVSGTTAAFGRQIEENKLNFSEWNVGEMVVDAVIVGVLAGVGSSYGNKKIEYTSRQIKYWIKPGSFKTMITGNYMKKITKAVAYSAIPALDYAFLTSLKGDQYENSKIIIE
ncbi:RHS repeat-associated core domain-containing protein [Mariniplasma anaerobium]|uniref:RHS repeat-associated core domain-containing protein n=1 Tax=Mariniplasma anaerobium TaxID=2735436 RepID=A0A7U9TGI1_9MOLU|nr:RHS repeat-associated core domain-containing protein [Mariniplasma anaerobium]BCR35643.1 hypothetical protein MPAN_005360 [Mariniplasma anaerobium]